MHSRRYNVLEWSKEMWHSYTLKNNHRKSNLVWRKASIWVKALSSTLAINVQKRCKASASKSELFSLGDRHLCWRSELAPENSSVARSLNLYTGSAHNSWAAVPSRLTRLMTEIEVFSIIEGACMQWPHGLNSLPLLLLNQQKYCRLLRLFYCFIVLSHRGLWALCLKCETSHLTCFVNAL